MGSAVVGVDHRAPLRSGIIRFRRAGGKVIAELENTTFVATSGSSAQKASVANSFTQTGPFCQWSRRECLLAK